MEASTVIAAAALLVVYGALAARLEALLISPAMFFVAGGFVLGASGLGWIDLATDPSIVRACAEATLVLVLFTDAARIDLAALRREFLFPVRLLGIGLPLTILAGTLLALVVIGGIGVFEALVLAVVLAPTDAALGQAVVSDPRLPLKVRQSLNVESGLNDGLCVPLLLIALALASAEEGVIGGGAAAMLVAEEIGFGVVGGVIAGVAAAVLLGAAARAAVPISAAWLAIVPVGAAALAYGIALALGGSGFIAAFVGGMVFGSLRRDRHEEADELIEGIGGILNALTFLIFGAVFIGPFLSDLTLPLVVLAVGSLTVVRMLPVAIGLIGARARPPTVAFMGWFGPRGLASIVFAVIVVEESGLTYVREILIAIAATVTLSVFAHGLSARPLTARYVRWHEGRRGAAERAMEDEPAPDLAVRWRRFGPTAS
jgi:NhaP-type Na+/H+ or K+/H+ antiporter